MRLLIGQTAFARHGDEIAAVDPSVELLVMADDGALHLVDGTPVALDGADIDAAWASGDLFTEDGPAGAFMDAVLTSPTLRWFQSPAAGHDHPMYPQLIARGVRVTNSHGQSLPIAEFVLRAALEHFQDSPGWRAAQAERIWHRRRFREISGTTWLIIGLGAIGADVATRAAAFGAHTIGVRRTPTGTEPVHEMLTTDELAGAIPRADVIVLAAASNPSTHHIVDAGFLERVSPNALLINVGRGALIDEAALLASLARGVPEAAHLDVAEIEPLPEDHPFWTHPRVAITPHNSAVSDGGVRRSGELFVRNLAAFLADGPLENELTADDVADAPAVGPRGPGRI